MLQIESLDAQAKVMLGIWPPPGVQAFFRDRLPDSRPFFLSVITVGELPRGVDLIRHRRDEMQATRLEAGLPPLLDGYRAHIGAVDAARAQRVRAGSHGKS